MEDPRSRSDWRDEVAAELAATQLERIADDGPVLVMEDHSPVVSDRLAAGGVGIHSWWRRAFGSRPASPWPPQGPFSVIAIRLPRAKPELDMMLHAATGRLVRRGHVLVYGANDEGIRSATGRMEQLFEQVETVALGGRCRVIQGRAGRGRSDLSAGLDAWRLAFPSGLPELPEVWASYPGVFAHGRVDGGTALLLASLPRVAPQARVLDYGCGHGVLGGVMMARTPTADVHFLDVDTVALEAVRANLPDARTILSEGWEAVADERYDLIVSNPPYHRGKGESLHAIEMLLRDAPEHMESQAALYLVAQRRLGVGPLLDHAFGHTAALADDGPWRVWHARDPTLRE